MIRNVFFGNLQNFLRDSIIADSIWDSSFMAKTYNRGVYEIQKVIHTCSYHIVI